MKPELRPKAKAALRLVYYFLTEDEAFQEHFEKLSVFTVARKLKLERHILEGPEEHRRMCCRMIWVMTTRFRKFYNWRNYVRAPAHELVLNRRLAYFFSSILLDFFYSSPNFNRSC